MREKIMVMIILLISSFFVQKVSADDWVCPEIPDGHFWIFNAQESVGGGVTDSALLNGDYKVVFKKDHVVVEGHPYQDSLLERLFECNKDGSGFVRSSLKDGMSWNREFTRRIGGQDFLMKSATRVVGATTWKSGSPLFRMHSDVDVMQRNKYLYSIQSDYQYSEELQSVVAYQLSSKDRPVSAKVILIAIGSEDSGAIQFVDINGPVDDATKQRVINLFGRKTRSVSASSLGTIKEQADAKVLKDAQRAGETPGKAFDNSNK